MSESKFERAVKIVQALPKDGPVKPSTEDKLYVSLVVVSGVISSPIMDHPQFYKYYKQGMRRTEGRSR